MMQGHHIMMEWHDEAERFQVWGTLDPTHACMCTPCVLGKPCEHIGGNGR